MKRPRHGEGRPGIGIVEEAGDGAEVPDLAFTLALVPDVIAGGAHTAAGAAGGNEHLPGRSRNRGFLPKATGLLLRWEVRGVDT